MESYYKKSQLTYATVKARMIFQSIYTFSLMMYPSNYKLQKLTPLYALLLCRERATLLQSTSLRNVLPWLIGGLLTILSSQSVLAHLCKRDRALIQ